MKKGVSLVSLVVIIVIMGILAGIVVASGFNSSENVTIDTFALELLDVQNGVDEYYYRYEKYPAGDEYILDTTKLESLEQFTGENVVENTINFKIVDLSLIGINQVEFGKGKGQDIYVLSENTGIVYYLEGIKFENKTYYTLTDELYDIANANNSDLVSTQDIKVYNVIFSPSTTEYTNKPITVEIKIPKIAVINSVTTTNNKSVGTETVQGLYKQIQINETSTDKTGNYKITVNYTYRGKEKTSEYEVKNYDANLPTVTYTETINGDLKTVDVTIDSNSSKIKTIKYEQEIISDITYFENYGKKITNNRFIVDKDEYFTIYVETEAGTNLMVNNMPEDWKENVVDVVDGVPIPKGFVASGAIGENKKYGGLVIYEGNTPVTDANVEDAKRERNQYVWVPIAKEEFTTKFVRSNFDGSANIVNELGSSGYWEIVLDKTTNMPLAEQDETFVSRATLAEAQELYASVKKYEGFWVGRYEEAWYENKQLSIDAKVCSMMGKQPFYGMGWGNSMSDDTGKIVELARKQYESTDSLYGVVSTLIYGVQWDSILQWWLDTKAVNSVLSSLSYGNYQNRTISNEELNEGAMYKTATNDFKDVENASKDATTSWTLTTGALKTAKVNNIYDMAGNYYEYTMEGLGTNNRIVRGRDSASDDSYNYVSVRGQGAVNSVTGHSFRICLYIK